MMQDRNFQLHTSTMFSIGGALAYVVLPTDMVPDFIPFVGWIDDALVLKIIMDSAREEVERYRLFRIKS
jgi:uncharacterized membrane protein YkvA (DUF1232 family)